MVIPRQAVRPGDEVFIVNSQSRLELRKLDIVKRLGNQLFVSAGLNSGDLICITSLDDAIPGMLVRLANNPVVGS